MLKAKQSFGNISRQHIYKCKLTPQSVPDIFLLVTQEEKNETELENLEIFFPGHRNLFHQVNRILMNNWRHLIHSVAK